MGETYILSMNEANTIEMMDYCGDKLKTPSYIKNGWFKIDLPDQLLKKELINDLLRYDEKYNVMTPKYEPFMNSNSNMYLIDQSFADVRKNWTRTSHMYMAQCLPFKS